jgi:hypothetical protein
LFTKPKVSRARFSGETYATSNLIFFKSLAVFLACLIPSSVKRVLVTPAHKTFLL